MWLFQSIERVLSKIETTFLASVMIFSSLLLFFNVIMRYIFHNAIYWAGELSCYLMVWLIFVGSSQVVKEEGHISVSLLSDLVPKKVRRYLQCFVTIFSLFFCIILTFYSFEHVVQTKDSHQISPALEMPMWIAYLSIPVGSALTSFRYIQHLKKCITASRPEDIPGHKGQM